MLRWTLLGVSGGFILVCKDMTCRAIRIWLRGIMILISTLLLLHLTFHSIIYPSMLLNLKYKASLIFGIFLTFRVPFSYRISCGKVYFYMDGSYIDAFLCNSGEE